MQNQLANFFRMIDSKGTPIYGYQGSEFQLSKWKRTEKLDSYPWQIFLLFPLFKFMMLIYRVFLCSFRSNFCLKLEFTEVLNTYLFCIWIHHNLILDFPKNVFNNKLRIFLIQFNLLLVKIFVGLNLQRNHHLNKNISIFSLLIP